MTPLRQRMLEDMGIRNLSTNTQLSYLQQVSSYAKHFHRSPEVLGPQEVRAYQVHLTAERKLSASSIGIATSALRFLYKVTFKQNWAPDEIAMPKKPSKLPVVLSPEEVMHFLDCIESTKHKTILMTAYAAGLRVSEATHLKVTDIDSQRMVLRIDQGNRGLVSEWNTRPPLPPRHAVVFELPTQSGVVRHHGAYRVPKTRTVVHDPQVAELVRHHVVDHRLAKVNQPPVQADRSVNTGTAPTSAGVAQAQASPLHLQQRCKVV